MVNVINSACRFSTTYSQIPFIKYSRRAVRVLAPSFVSWSLRATIERFHSSHFCRRIGIKNATMEATAIDAAMDGSVKISPIIFKYIWRGYRMMQW